MRFYFDYISPYAYLAWTQMRGLSARTGVAVEPVPILFAALLNHWGHKGPAEIPPKRLYVFKDVVRRAHAYGVPLQPPPSHPFNPLLALRVTEAAPADRTAEVVDTLFAHTWGDAQPRGVDQPETMRAILAPLGLEALVEAAGTKPIKDAIRTHTEAALTAGVFGVPSMVVEGEVFWGTDSLAHLENHLNGDDPVDDALLARWRDLPVGQARR